MVAVDLVCALGKVFTMLDAISAWLSGCITEYWIHWLGFVSGFRVSGVLGITIVGVLSAGYSV